jgi:DNA polymerase I
MKTVIFDTETNGIKDYTKFHVGVFKDVKTKEVFIFRRVHEDASQLINFLRTVTGVIGHNLNYDLRVIQHFTGLDLWHLVTSGNAVDTLVVSRLVNYNQPGGHSLEAWGERFGMPKDTFSDFSEYSQELENRCIQDVLLTERLYNTLRVYLEDTLWKPSINLEHLTNNLCRVLEDTGFTFDKPKAEELRDELQNKVDHLLFLFNSIFPPKFVPDRVIEPKVTKSGALHSKDFRWMKDEVKDLSTFAAGVPFTLGEWIPFNPSSPSQIVERLNRAGWRPFDKTKGHIEAERNRGKGSKEARKANTEALEHYRVYGWKVSQENLETLSPDAPDDAKRLAEYLLLKSRLDDLKEWLGLWNEKTGRIHGNFNHIGSWTGRKSHSRPNMANIPALINRKGNEQPYGAAFRSLWTASKGRCLIGTDAEGIQLRLFAHYCNDEKLIKAIEEGKKENKTDIHSLNMGVLNTIYTLRGNGAPICLSREVSKTYIYALLLGAGKGKQASVLDCTPQEAEEGLERIIEYYPGWKKLKETTLIEDAKRGYFIGLDGRRVLFPSAHKILAGYLQNGESIVMKMACVYWTDVLKKAGIPFWQVNDVHDEWQTETLPEYAQMVAHIQEESIRIVGEKLGLNCKLAGKAKIGYNWKDTH